MSYHPCCWISRGRINRVRLYILFFRQLVEELSLTEREPHYIGLTEEPEGEWYWLDDLDTVADPDSIHWSSGEPDNNEGGQHCGQFQSPDWRTYDRPCGYQHFAICEIPACGE